MKGSTLDFLPPVFEKEESPDEEINKRNSGAEHDSCKNVVAVFSCMRFQVEFMDEALGFLLGLGQLLLDFAFADQFLRVFGPGHEKQRNKDFNGRFEKVLKEQSGHLERPNALKPKGRELKENSNEKPLRSQTPKDVERVHAEQQHHDPSADHVKQYSLVGHWGLGQIQVCVLFKLDQLVNDSRVDLLTEENDQNENVAEDIALQLHQSDFLALVLHPIRHESRFFGDACLVAVARENRYLPELLKSLNDVLLA